MKTIDHDRVHAVVFAALAVVFAALAAAPAAAQTDLQPAAIVRLTRSEPITVKQVKDEARRMLWETAVQQRGRAPTTDEVNTAIKNLSATERRQVVELMVNNKLAVQAAERDKITVTDNEVNQQIQQVRATLAQQAGRQPTDTEFADAIYAQTGMDQPSFRAYLKQQLIIQKYLLEKKKDVLQSIASPTAAEIQNFYNLNKAKLIRPETVRVTGIVVPFTDTASKTTAKATAERLVREIGKSADKFDEAVNKAQSAGSGYQAGDMGYLPRSAEAQQQVGQTFMDTAFGLKPGEVSGLLESPRAYQIIKVTETYAQKQLELSDIFQLGAQVTVQQYIANGLFQETQQSVLEKATAELVTELRAGNPFQIMESALAW